MSRQNPKRGKKKRAFIYPIPKKEPYWVRFDPDVAREWLELIIKNRVPDLNTISGYARDMAAGTWEQGADMPLCLNQKGALINGEQRLRAVIKANVEISFVVVDSLSCDAIMNIDNGKPRNLQNWLQLNGIPQPGFVASCTRALWMIRNTALELVKSTPGGLATQYDYVSTFRQEPKIVESVTWVKDMMKKTDIRLRVAVLATLRHVLLQTRHARWVNEFLTQIITGQDMDQDSGTYAYRIYIQCHNCEDMRGKPSWLNTQADDYGAIVIAWNAWINEQVLYKEDCIWTQFPRHLDGLPTDIAGRRTLSKSHSYVEGVFHGRIKNGKVTGRFKGRQKM